MNVLFIGNSYTYYNDLDKLFEGLCRENGKQVNAFRVTKGGRRLDAYLDSEDPTTRQLETILQERHYDVCFLQEQSLLPALDYDAFLAGVTHVKRMVGNQADRFLLYATWARKLGSPDLEMYGWSREEMTRLLDESYRRVGKALGIHVSPVGINFLNVIRSHPELDLHTPDLSHPSYLGSCLAALTHYHTLWGVPEKADSLGLDSAVLEVFYAALCAESS